MTIGWGHMWRMRRPLVRRAIANFLAGLLLVVVAVLALSPSSAKAWWNDDWQLRKKITIDASATGANITEPIGAATALIRLHVGNFRFNSAKDDGGDLRFVASDDKTPLKHHIEKYDPLLGEALIWVAIPDLRPGAKTDVWLYYGNKKAVPANDAKGSYDPDMLLVYHFNERGTPPLDSTVWANNAQSVGRQADGSIIGAGLRLDGVAPLTLPASPSLALAESASLTWSAWIKPAALQPNAVLYSRRDNGAGLVIGLDNGVPYVEVTTSAGVQRSGAGAPITPEAWHHVAVVAGGGQITLYLDGALYATQNAALPALNAVALIGGDAPAASVAVPGADAGPATAAAAAPAVVPGANAAPTTAAAAAPAGFAGDIDELQISKVARPAGFIKFAAVGQGPDPSKLISYSTDEETGSWLSGYFAVILKSVTLDGWVVIGLLMVMAVLSWLVMIDRSTYVGRQAKANTRFMKSFRELGSDLVKLDRGDPDDASSLGDLMSPADARMMRASSLYRIYHIGAAEIRGRFAGNDDPRLVLSPQSIAAIRAALDSNAIEETQRLNRLMVILTIAISGGPFLGLLGTVVGVMITFAAIAASGDVNVNAIAPGIAAALVATVAGLSVAIPALFGYNYLISRIKDLTTDIHVFVDEFVTKMAEFYSADRPTLVERRAAAE